jgi:parvulin-like peptidyl-prolyl isomerase
MRRKGLSVKAFQVLRGGAAAGLVVAVALLSGCASADRAAVVNGHVVTESEAQRSAREINEAFELQQPLGTRDVVGSLITAPLINKVAGEAGKAESDASAREAMPGVQDPSPATLELVKANFALQKLTDEEKGRIVEELRRADITVNPRYGRFNPQTVGFEASAPNWIQPSQQG